MNFFRDILKNFYSTAIYKSEDMAVPVSWIVRKVGGVHAFQVYSQGPSSDWP